MLDSFQMVAIVISMRFSLRTKLIFLIATPLFVVFLFALYYVGEEVEYRLESQLAMRAKMVMTSLANVCTFDEIGSTELINNRFLDNFVDRLFTVVDDLYRIVVKDRDGKVILDRKRESRLRGSVERFPMRVKSKGDTLFVIESYMSDFHKIDSIKNLKKRMFFLILVTLLGVILFSYSVSYYVTRPLNELSHNMKLLEQGHLDISLTSLKRKDEIGDLFYAFEMLLEALKERNRIYQTFARYVSPPIAKKILETKDKKSLTGEMIRVSVLYTDIRNFTTIVEFKGADRVLEMLNGFYGIVLDVILKYGGTIDKIIGDAVMAYFGAPLPLEDHAERAVKSAVEILERLEEFNKRQLKKGEPAFRAGFGISTGVVIAGEIGSDKFVDYTIIGDTVNMAARIQEETKNLAGKTLLVCEETFRMVKDSITLEEYGYVSLKGKHK